MARGSKPGERRGGRQKGTRNKHSPGLTELVAEFSERAIRTLAAVMDDTTAPPAARVSASLGLLKKSLPDLAAVEHTGKDGGAIVLQITPDDAKL